MAFPFSDGFNQPQYGMTLRDYFAAKAIGLFPLDSDDCVALKSGQVPDHKIVARFCYELADAMLAVREGGAK